MYRIMNVKKEQFKSLLLKIFSERDVNKITLYLSNPAKYPQIIDILKRIKMEVSKKRDLLSSNDYYILNNCLDDELAFALLITQNSKCDPFKFIKF